MDDLVWTSVKRFDQRQRHHTSINGRRLSVYGWADDRFDWTVYDQTGEIPIAYGRCASLDEAKAAAMAATKERHA